MPSVIFAVKLAKYYRIMDEEAPYRPPKKSKKKKNQRRSDEEVPMDEMDANTGTNPKPIQWFLEFDIMYMYVIILNKMPW